MIYEKIDEIKKRIKGIRIKGIEIEKINEYGVRNPFTNEIENYIDIYILKRIDNNKYKTKLITIDYDISRLYNNFGKLLNEIEERAKQEIYKIAFEINGTDKG